MDSRETHEVAVLEAQQQVAIAQADLAKVQAGAQQGEIGAQTAEISRLAVERSNQIAGQKATIRRLEATRDGEIATQQAVIDRLRAELANANADAARYADLFSQGAVAASQRDSFRLAANTAQKSLQEAQANLARIRTARQAEIDEARAALSRIQSGQGEQIRSAEATLERIAEVRPVDIEIAEAQLKAAQASLKRAEVELEKSFIKAPQPGRVLEILARPGETIGNDGLLRLAQTQEMRAIAEVYESDIQKLAIGQPVTLTSPSLPEDLTGQVSRIGLEVERQEVVNTDPAANIDARVVEVEIELDEASIEQVQGFSNLQVTVTIELNRNGNRP
ncbi:MAG: HlyD family efflux transporter periplasmic adaptor subunit [Synechococcales cyanobacterium RM1_1_8]|nr:HlyD family efflux transporter periplasmic adaptor subunit [Synechococcales cyanobacterium RM1_1_8]